MDAPPEVLDQLDDLLTSLGSNFEVDWRNWFEPR